MPIPLSKTLRREILIDGQVHTVAIGPHGVRVTPKGFRRGRALRWDEVLALGAEAGAIASGDGDTARRAGGVLADAQRNSRSDRQ